MAVTQLPAHTRERIDEIRAFHRPQPRRYGIHWWQRLRRRPVCLVCWEPGECRQTRWAADVEAGRVAPVGWGMP